MIMINEVRGRWMRVIYRILLSLMLPVGGKQTIIWSHSLEPFCTQLVVLIALRELVGHQVAVRCLIKHGSARITSENGTDLLHGAGRDQRFQLVWMNLLK